MDPDSFQRSERRRIAERLRQVPKPAHRRENSERAHLQRLRQLLREASPEEIKALATSSELCVYCGLTCLDPVLVSTFPVAQQMVWDALHQRYTEAVARVFFAQMVNDLDPDDEDAWLARLERMTD